MTTEIQQLALADGAAVMLDRGRGPKQLVRLGPNEVHAVVVRGPSGQFGKPGDYEDLGVSYNLLTNGGRDLMAAAMGNATGKDGAFTATSSTSGTPSGGGMTTDQYKGWRVYAPVAAITTAPVYGNIGSNSATVLTVDGWWVGTSDTMTGTTPSATNGYHIQPSTIARFMGITTDASAASASNTTLTSEATTNGGGRAKATYAHTASTATFTLTNTYTFSGTFTALHRMALFTAANTTAAGIMVFETVLNQDATVGSGDTMTVTWTGTITG